MQSISLNKPGAFSYKIDFPENWNELTTAELELVAKAQLAHAENEGVSKAVVFTSIIDHRATAIGIKLPADWKQNLNYDEAAAQGFDAIAFLYISNFRTVNPYPTLLLGKKRVIGPEDDFNEITCGEMEDCEVSFLRMQTEPSLELLAKIAAVLWRPRNAKYKSKTSDQRLHLFKKLPEAVLFSIYIWYTGCRNRLPLYFPEVYAGGETADEPDLLSFTKCIHAGAGVKNGTRENIRSISAKEFLFDMNLEAEQARKMKEEHDRS